MERPVRIVERFPANRDEVGLTRLQELLGMLHWHIGEITTRLRSMMPRIAGGVNSIGDVIP